MAALEEERRQAARFEEADGTAPDVLEELLDLLRQAVRDLQEVNETNRLLARQSLAYTRKVLALLVPEDKSPVLMDQLV